MGLETEMKHFQKYNEAFDAWWEKYGEYISSTEPIELTTEGKLSPQEIAWEGWTAAIRHILEEIGMELES